LNEGGVDVDLAHVVHDYGDTHTFTIVKDVVQERRLSGSEESGKYGNWKTGIIHVSIIPIGGIPISGIDLALF
jgi:hypothetical protein